MNYYYFFLTNGPRDRDRGTGKKGKQGPSLTISPHPPLSPIYIYNLYTSPRVAWGNREKGECLQQGGDNSGSLSPPDLQKGTEARQRPSSWESTWWPGSPKAAAQFPIILEWLSFYWVQLCSPQARGKEALSYRLVRKDNKRKNGHRIRIGRLQ